MTITYENGEVVIRVPVTADIIKNAPMSGSGKSRMIASTGGFVGVNGAPAGVKIGLNVIGPR